MPIQPPDAERTWRTFRLELWRSVPVGMIEYMFVPFAGLVALKHFDASEAQKAFLLAIAQVGLIASFVTVPLVRRLGWGSTGAAAFFHFVAAAGLVLAAALPDSLEAFIVGLSVGMFAFMLPMPLMTGLYQANYPASHRGTLYGWTTIARGLVAVLFAHGAAELLDGDIGAFRHLLWVFAAVSVWAGVLVLRIPAVPVAGGSRNPFVAFRWLRADKKFRILIVSWMLMGLGNLTTLKIWTEYFANERYGNGFSAKEVTYLTVVIPVTVKLIFTYPWAWLFDRLNFYLLRLILNACFIVAVLVVFFGEGFGVIALGTALQGFAFAGGNIAWSLWVTKVAPPEHTAEYMSVHTFTTGVRGVIAPVIGFWFLNHFGGTSAAVFSAALMVLASIVLIPDLRFGRARRRGEALAPEDPSV